MVEAAEFQRVTPSLALWQVYDPAVKADLFSTAVLAGGSVFLVDPVPLAPTALQELLRGRPIGGVLVTNSNHLRASAEMAQAHRAPVFCAPILVPEFGRNRAIAVANGMEILGQITPIALPGAPTGEFAFHFPEDGGALVV